MRILAIFSLTAAFDSILPVENSQSVQLVNEVVVVTTTTTTTTTTWADVTSTPSISASLANSDLFTDLFATSSSQPSSVVTEESTSPSTSRKPITESMANSTSASLLAVNRTSSIFSTYPQLTTKRPASGVTRTTTVLVTPVCRSSIGSRPFWANDTTFNSLVINQTSPFSSNFSRLTTKRPALGVTRTTTVLVTPVCRSSIASRPLWANFSSANSLLLNQTSSLLSSFPQLSTKRPASGVTRTTTVLVTPLCSSSLSSGSLWANSTSTSSLAVNRTSSLFSNFSKLSTKRPASRITRTTTVLVTPLCSSSLSSEPNGFSSIATRYYNSSRVLNSSRSVMSTSLARTRNVTSTSWVPYLNTASNLWGPYSNITGTLRSVSRNATSTPRASVHHTVFNNRWGPYHNTSSTSRTRSQNTTSTSQVPFRRVTSNLGGSSRNATTSKWWSTSRNITSTSRAPSRYVTSTSRGPYRNTTSASGVSSRNVSSTLRSSYHNTMTNSSRVRSRKAVLPTKTLIITEFQTDVVTATATRLHTVTFSRPGQSQVLSVTISAPERQ